MTNLYLDSDGVLLTAKHPQAAPGVEAFVEFITAHFQCYWLTTHCKGDSAPALRYLAEFLKPTTLEKLRTAVQPTNWDTLKTEATDVTTDFYWLDDLPLQAEAILLESQGLDSRLIRIDLTQAEELANVILLLNSYAT